MKSNRNAWLWKMLDHLKVIIFSKPAINSKLSVNINKSIFFFPFKQKAIKLRKSYLGVQQK